MDSDRVYALVYALRHIETGEYICLRPDGDNRDHVAAFTWRGDCDAFAVQNALGGTAMIEFCDIVAMPLNGCPFHCFWLDGQYAYTH